MNYYKKKFLSVECQYPVPLKLGISQSLFPPQTSLAPLTQRIYLVKKLKTHWLGEPWPSVKCFRASYSQDLMQNSLKLMLCQGNQGYTEKPCPKKQTNTQQHKRAFWGLTMGLRMERSLHLILTTWFPSLGPASCPLTSKWALWHAKVPTQTSWHTQINNI